MNTAAPRPSALARTWPRCDHQSRSNHEASALPAREASYSIAPPRIGFCRTSAPIGQRNDFRMTHPTTPPGSLCILRLSAIGDTCHVVPVVRTLQRVWPATRLTWIIGRARGAAHEAAARGRVYHHRQARPGWRSAARLAPRAARAPLRPAAAHAAVAAREPGLAGGARAAGVWVSIARARASCNGCSPMRTSRRASTSTCSTAFRVSWRRLGLRARCRSNGICRCRRRRAQYAAAH